MKKVISLIESIMRSGIFTNQEFAADSALKLIKQPLKLSDTADKSYLIKLPELATEYKIIEHFPTLERVPSLKLTNTLLNLLNAVKLRAKPADIIKKIHLVRCCIHFYQYSCQTPSEFTDYLESKGGGELLKVLDALAENCTKQAHPEQYRLGR